MIREQASFDQDARLLIIDFNAFRNCIQFMHEEEKLPGKAFEINLLLLLVLVFLF